MSTTAAENSAINTPTSSSSVSTINVISSELDRITTDKISFLHKIYYIIVILIYIGLIALTVFKTENGYHFFSLMCAFASFALIFKVLDIVIFSKELYHYLMTMQKVPGIYNNVVPKDIIPNKRKHVDSISGLAAPIGSTFQRWMSATVNIGSISGLSIAIYGLFDIVKFHDNSIQTKIALRLFTSAMVGGIILANIPIYAAPNYSTKYLNGSLILHYIGAFLYFFVGNLAYMVYVDFTPLSCILMCAMITSIIVWCILSGHVSKSKKFGKISGFVNFISRVSIVAEVVGGSISVFVLCYLGWILGDEIESYKDCPQ